MVFYAGKYLGRVSFLFQGKRGLKYVVACGTVCPNLYIESVYRTL